MPITLKNIKTDKIIAIINHKKLHNFILNKVSNELAKLSESCYYPKVNLIYKELLYLSKTDEKKLKLYSYNKYKNPKWRLLHDPYTILLVLIIQDSVKQKDIAEAISAFNLLALRNYSNLMWKTIRYCNRDYFDLALNKLSHSHLFRQKRTIGSSILHLSKSVYQRFYKALQEDDTEKIVIMIYEIRHRISQSIKSFASKYYMVAADKEKLKSVEDDEEIYKKETLEIKIKNFSSKISKDICVYGKIDKQAMEQSIQITKFNKKLAIKYIQTINKIKYLENVNLLINLMLKNISNFENICNIKFLDYVRSLMAVKTSSKPIFFKKILIKIHSQIIEDLKYQKWFDGLSTQSKATSRNFLAYYITFIIRRYIC